MTTRLTRRAALVGSILAGSTLMSPRSLAAPDAQDRIVDLEAKNGGRLGVAVLDTASGRSVNHRADERFAMCSTFKLLAAAHVLARADAGEERLDRRVVYTQADVMPNSPIGKDHVGDGMTIAQLCEAAVTVSDNTADNLLLASAGGPAGFTAYARSLGDPLTRLDRVEPELNDVKAGDPRDTTTPGAMLEDLQKLVLGDALKASSRDQLIAWMMATKTGGARLRAGFPKGWRVGDKTGTSGTNISNDIAVAWPPGRAPIIVTTYYAESSLNDDRRNAVIAEVGAIIAATMV